MANRNGCSCSTRNGTKRRRLKNGESWWNYSVLWPDGSGWRGRVSASSKATAAKKARAQANRLARKPASSRAYVTVVKMTALEMDEARAY